MKIFLFVIVQVVLLFQVGHLYAGSLKSEVFVEIGDFEHIEFKKITPSNYIIKSKQLKIEVNGGASFLMKAFDDIKEVEKVSFKWRSEGVPEIKNAEHESQREGDDAVFKLGVLLHGDEPFPNPFIPSWVKRVEKLLKHPSEDMVYLVVDAKHVPGEKWLSPYNERITMISVDSVVDEDGWQVSSYRFEEPVSAVGLWLMSDGDNTDSSFTTYVKGIKLN